MPTAPRPGAVAIAAIGWVWRERSIAKDKGRKAALGQRCLQIPLFT
jgi:hypothetical protein